MTIESKLDALTAAIVALTATVERIRPGAPTPPQPTPTSAPVGPIPVPAAPAMPPFAMPGAPVAPPASAVPFSDAKGLLTYVMEAYKAMGPAKGAGIQTVLTNLGVGNINDVTPDKYAALHAGVEALKNG